jgi:tripartite-type tricarboxylate transporter receptor subunit TctC
VPSAGVSLTFIFQFIICVARDKHERAWQDSMKLPHRRQFLHLAAGAAALPALPCIARAQAYPSRPVRWIVGFTAGGASDIIARLMGQWLTERLGQSIVIENRPGAASNIATEMAIRAPTDGYTLMMVNPSHAINATLYDKLNFNFVRDIAPVASFYRVPVVMAVNPSIPAKSVPEFIAYAKANPGKVNMASSGVGTTPHFTGELFKMMTGVSMVHVPYRGAGPAVTDLIAGQVQVMFDTMSTSIEYIRAGQLRALAVTATSRAQALPDTPTMADYIPGFESSGWQGVGVPSATPAEIVEKLNREINAILAEATVKARLADFGGTPLPLKPADFGKLVAEETEKWAKVIKFAGIKPE